MSEEASAQTEIIVLLEGMITHQREKVSKIAHRLNPRLTAEDLLNPFDWPEVAENPQFAWEDGLLAGLQAAHAAVLARQHHPRYAPSTNPPEAV